MDIKPIIIKSLKDLPEAPVSQGTTLVRKTGTWKNVRPQMGQRSGPCENACPLRIRIPKYIDYLTKGEPEIAALEILKTNPFPTITGRLCPAKCEIACNRNKYDERISIKELERFLGDLILSKKEIKTQAKTGKKVAIVGTSLSAMTAAYKFVETGFDVHIYTGGKKPFEDTRGNVPDEILESETNTLVKSGIQFLKESATNLADLEKQYDYIFVSTKSQPNLISNIDPKTGKSEKDKIYGSIEDQDISKTIKNAITSVMVINAEIEGKEYTEERPPRVVTYKEVVVDYFNHEPAIRELKTLEDAIKEAKRCFSCGTCNSCGNCYVFCPDSAVKWVNNFPEFDYDYCKGCGVCVNECPRGVLELVPEK